MKKIIALVLVAAMMLLCGACTKYTVLITLDDTATGSADNSQDTGSADVTANTGDTQDADTQQADDPIPADTSAPAATETADTQPAVTDTATDTPAAAESDATTQAAESTATGAPSSKEDIINYYVTAYNKIGTDNGTITRTYDYTSNYNDILHINDNSTLEKLANTLMTKFMVETTDPIDTSFSDLPPKGVTNLSISPEQISSATCQDNGSTYTIVLKSTGTDDNYEVDCQPGEGSAGVIGPLLRTEDVSSAAGSLLSFEGLHAWYATASVTVTVDKASGHITDFYFNTPCILHFDQVTVAILKVQNCDIGLLFEQKYTVTY